MKNNKAMLKGIINEPLKYSHKVNGESFYETKVAVTRTSGTVDTVPVLLSERLAKVTDDLEGMHVRVAGEFRSHNTKVGDHMHLVLALLAQELDFAEAVYEDVNEVELIGYVCKQPVYRKTPLGREIGDILIAVNRPYGKSDYIPCVAWGRNAKYARMMEVGEHLRIKGRMQSRKYDKKLSDGTIEKRTAYEVSVERMDVLPVEVQGKEYLGLLEEIGCKEGMGDNIYVVMEDYELVALGGWDGTTYTDCYLSDEHGYPRELDPQIRRFRPVTETQENGCTEIIGFKELA